jgi:hypothetical protein
LKTANQLITKNINKPLLTHKVCSHEDCTGRESSCNYIFP